jgi:predicted nucleic acid-binding protein
MAANTPSPIATQTVVTNTTPLIALTAATGSLDVLRFLYARVVVPLEVQTELRAAGPQALGVAALNEATWLDCRPATVTIAAYLANTLDRGEASVIQTAIDLGIPLVCIDETVGRRVARLSGLTLTGSIGILLKAKQLGYGVSMDQAVARMRQHGIWLSDTVTRFALGTSH